MTTQKHLAQQALDGISLVCSDLEVLGREIAISKPVTAMLVTDTLGRAKVIEQEIQHIYGLIEGE